jgi:putative phosphoesterase
MAAGDAVRLGVVSDTHGRFDPKIPRLFRGVEAILHAGDIGAMEVIRALEAIAPVYAVEGNNDRFGNFPEERVECFAGRRVLLRHIFGELHQLRAAQRALLQSATAEVVVFGHSHRPYRARLGGTLLFNPGSAGPRRFALPRTVGLLRLEPGRIDARIAHLD